MVSIIVLLLLLPLHSTYSEDFVARYSDNYANNDNTFLVIQRDKGCIIVENIMFRQFEYPLHVDRYNSYHSFLMDVLNDTSVVLHYKWEEIRIKPYLCRTQRQRERIMAKYLFRDSNNRIMFNKNLSKKKEYGIIKLMFDYGYFIGRTDYSALWLFYDSLAPSIEPIPE